MTPEDLTALVQELEDVHADTEDDQAAGVLLRAMGALRVAARHRCAERPAEPDREALIRDMAEAIEQAEDEDGGPLDAARAALAVVDTGGAS